jgi:hypothetical protein
MMGWTCSYNREEKECIQNFEWKRLGKHPLGRPREMGCEDGRWMEMIQDREDVLPQCKIIVTKENVKYTYCYGFPLRGLSCLKFVEKLSVVILQKLDT